MPIDRDLGELVTTTERTTAAQRELLAVQKEIAKSRGVRSELWAQMDEDIRGVVARLADAREEL